jgi:hypothetical protein
MERKLTAILCADGTPGAAGILDVEPGRGDLLECGR